MSSKSLRQYSQELREWLVLSRLCWSTNYYYQKIVFAQNAGERRNTHYISASQTLRDQTPLQQDQNSETNQAANSPPRTFPFSAGTEVHIPPVWKRGAAEVIDCAILIFVKFIISYILINYFGFKASQILDFDYALFTGELDIEKIYALSSDIILVEFIHRIFVSLYEAVCLAYVSNVLPPGGFTPGKKLMNLAVISCEEVFSLGNGRFLVTDVRNPSFKSTLSRSLLKNFSLSLMIPTCLTMFMFEHRRTVYDVATNTVVIESI